MDAFVIIFVYATCVDSRTFSGPFVVVKVSQNSEVGKPVLYFMLHAVYYILLTFSHT